MNRWNKEFQSCDADEEAETTEPVRAPDIQQEAQSTNVRQISLFLLLINIIACIGAFLLFRRAAASAAGAASLRR